jgi:hypothetical protein
MARRETVKLQVRCPACGKAGTAIVEENETPPHHNGRLDRRWDSIPAGFPVKRMDDDCLACDEHPNQWVAG